MFSLGIALNKKDIAVYIHLVNVFISHVMLCLMNLVFFLYTQAMLNLKTQIIQTPLSSDNPEDSTGTELHYIYNVAFIPSNYNSDRNDSLNSTTV